MDINLDGIDYSILPDYYYNVTNLTHLQVEQKTSEDTGN
jgi:hypothetical protein